MIFQATSLAGAVVVELEPRTDDRGFFARSWCRAEFRAAGLCDALEQCNISFNRRRGTLRGLHYQADPHGEIKLVRCIAGAVFDVIVDIRRGSPSFGKWFGVELSARNRRALYIPQGFAHGFLTLTDEAELFYQMSTAYVADAARGLRWNDPAIAIDWPFAPDIMSDCDADFPLLDDL